MPFLRPLVKWTAIAILVLLHVVAVFSIFQPAGSTVNWRLVRVLLFSGTLVFFMGNDMPRTGFSCKGHWITAPSPAPAWRVLGGVLWLAAILYLVAMA